MEENSNIEPRFEKINQLRQYVKNIDDRIQFILHEFDWDSCHLLAKDDLEMGLCSINPQHKIPIARRKEHEEKCQWIKDGYNEKDLPFSENLNSNMNSQIVLTPQLQKSILSNAASEFYFATSSTERPVPKTTDKLQQDFTREERLALYDFAIENSQRVNEVLNLQCSMDVEEKKEKSSVLMMHELAVAERDAKRRRATYRNKVHTNKKSQTEILREVIESQMESWKEDVTKPPSPTAGHLGRTKGRVGEGHERHRESRENYNSKWEEKRNDEEGHRYRETRDYHETSRYRDDRESSRCRDAKDGYESSRYRKRKDESFRYKEMRDNHESSSYKEMNSPESSRYKEMNNPESSRYKEMNSPESSRYKEMNNPESSRYKEMNSPESFRYKETTQTSDYNESFRNRETMDVRENSRYKEVSDDEGSGNEGYKDITDSHESFVHGEHKKSHHKEKHKKKDRKRRSDSSEPSKHRKKKKRKHKSGSRSRSR